MGPGEAISLGADYIVIGRPITKSNEPINQIIARLIQKLKNIKIKICGINNTTVLDCCSNLNVNYFGLIFYKKSPRNIRY